ncbi:hypothetical protein CsSME_00037386 [Camellia sinensis var. sinensis]
MGQEEDGNQFLTDGLVLSKANFSSTGLDSCHLHYSTGFRQLSRRQYGEETTPVLPALNSKSIEAHSFEGNGI